MRYTFASHFADDINAYIQLRKSLGNKEETFARRLHSFDRFCALHFPNDFILSREICEGWCTLQETENLATLRLRTGILRDFAKYLVSVQKKAYVIPDGYTGRPPRYFPYLYTQSLSCTVLQGRDIRCFSQMYKQNPTRKSHGSGKTGILDYIQSSQQIKCESPV